MSSPSDHNHKPTQVQKRSSRYSAVRPTSKPVSPPVPPPVIAPGGPYSTPDITVLPDENAPLEQALSGLRQAAYWVFWASLAAGSLILFTLVLDIRKGSQAKLPYNSNAENVTAYLSLLTMGLTIALIVFALAFLVLTWEDRSAGGMVASTGLLVHILLPWAVFGLFGRTAATAAVAQGFRHTGFVLAVLGGGKLAWDAFIWLRALPHRMRKAANVGISSTVAEQAREAARANVFSPCWQLSFCREVIRRQCPAYLAQTKCWKFGKGCFCDEEMINRIITGDSPALQMARTATRQVARKTSKPPCRRCYIYLEHQSHKLQWISPLAFPLAVGLTGLMWPLYNLIWKAFGGASGWLWSRIAFVPVAPEGPPARTGVPSGQLSPDQVSALAQNLIGLCLGFFLLIVLLRLVEYAIDRWGW